MGLGIYAVEEGKSLKWDDFKGYGTSFSAGYGVVSYSEAWSGKPTRREESPYLLKGAVWGVSSKPFSLSASQTFTYKLR